MSSIARASTEQPSENPAAKPKARRSIHKTILDWFAEQPRGKVLDAPAGYGHLCLRLHELGFDVDGGEINPDIFSVENVECVYTDLNRKIDADDNTYDYVCCVDGLEHMTDPFQAAKEFSRVLKPGGTGVFSIPNYSSMERRVKYLLQGFVSKPSMYDSYLAQNGNLFDFHNSHLTIVQLEFIFRISDLEIVEIKRNDKKKKQRFYYPLIWLLKTINFFTSDESKKRYRRDLTLKDEVLLGGNNLIFITRKVPGGISDSGI